jgi:peptidyl-dipeptidase A
MKSLFVSAAALALVATAATAAPVSKGAPTAAEAKSFVAKAEKELADVSVYAARAEWTYETYINDDTSYLTAKANTLATELATKYAKDAARFDRVKVDDVTRRKLLLLKNGLVLPSPDRPGAAQEMADLQARLAKLYSTGTATIDGKTLHLDDLEDELAKTRDPARAREIWEKWRLVSPPMKADYVRLTALANEGSRGIGYKDTGALWRSGYDMPPDQFAALTDRLWGQVKPFYVTCTATCARASTRSMATRSSRRPGRSAPTSRAICGPSSGATSMTWSRRPIARAWATT